MRLQTIKLLVLAVVAALILLVSHARTLDAKAFAQKTPAGAKASPDAELIDALDRAVQKRFHNVIGFGMDRIATTKKKFVPQTEEEKAAVASLKEAELKLGLYLAGRLVLEPKPREEEWGKFGFARAVSRPIFVGAKTKAEKLPDGLELWEQTQKALAAFKRGEELYEFKIDEWRVRARPVRARDATCLQCHNQNYRFVYLPGGAGGFETTPTNELKIGDLLGALLYAYSRAR